MLYTYLIFKINFKLTCYNTPTLIKIFVTCYIPIWFSKEMAGIGLKKLFSGFIQNSFACIWKLFLILSFNWSPNNIHSWKGELFLFDIKYLLFS